MSLFQAAVLGLVQGLTEFLPISSSGHLIVVPWLLGWPEHSLAFDAALHLGTVAALIAYFWRDWLEITRAVLAGLRDPDARNDPRWRLGWLLVIGTIPAALLGLAFESLIEELVREPWLVAMFLIAFGLLMALADRLGAKKRGVADVQLRDALVVGLAQAMALAPGVSRSGATITAGLLLGLERAAAARFSFLLSTPITLAAALYSMRRLVGPGATMGDGGAVLLVGILSAAISGLLAIRFLLRFLQKNSLSSFVLYRILLGLLILVMAGLGARAA